MDIILIEFSLSQLTVTVIVAALEFYRTRVDFMYINRKRCSPLTLNTEMSQFLLLLIAQIKKREQKRTVKELYLPHRNTPGFVCLFYILSKIKFLKIVAKIFLIFGQ